MGRRIGPGIEALSPGDIIEVRYRQMTIGGERPPVRRRASLTGRVRANTIGDLPEGFPGVEKLVAETSSRADRRIMEIWPDGGIRVTHKRDSTVVQGRLLEWAPEGGRAVKLEWPDLR